MAGLATSNRKRRALESQVRKKERRESARIHSPRRRFSSITTCWRSIFRKTAIRSPSHRTLQRPRQIPDRNPRVRRTPPQLLSYFDTSQSTQRTVVDLQTTRTITDSRTAPMSGLRLGCGRKSPRVASHGSTSGPRDWHTSLRELIYVIETTTSSWILVNKVDSTSPLTCHPLRQIHHNSTCERIQKSGGARAADDNKRVEMRYGHVRGGGVVAH